MGLFTQYFDINIWTVTFHVVCNAKFPVDFLHLVANVLQPEAMKEAFKKRTFFLFSG